MKPSELGRTIEVMCKARLPLLITGAPGIGKSDIVEQASRAIGYHLIVDHPAISDPTDYKGFPFAENGTANFLPFGHLREIIEASQPTIYFMDDIGQAPKSVQAACMQLLRARRIGNHVVSQHVTMLAATNRREDRAHVQGLLEPVKSRFASIVNLEPDLEDWIKWALQAGMPTELIAFVKFRPNLLHDFQPSEDLVNTPSPRTIENIGRCMLAGIPKELEYEVFTGAIGEGFASEFIGFLRIFRTLPNPDLIIMNPSQADVPNDPATLYALCGALAKKASEQNIGRLVEYYNRLPDEFSVLAMQMSQKHEPKIVTTRAYIDWHSKHSHVMM